MNGAPKLQLRMWGALALMLAYVLPVYWPPAATILQAPSAGASLMERLFPGIPPLWLWLRLAALLLGALALALPLGNALEWPDRPASPAHARLPAKLALQAALAFALVHVLVGFAASHFGRDAQLLYLVLLVVPALILFVATPDELRDMLPPAGVLVALIVLATGWFVLRVVPAWHSPRAASATDMWLNFSWFLDAAASDRNLLASRSEVSATDAWMLLAGNNLLGSGASLPPFPVMLTVGGLWLLAGAVALAAICGVGIHWWAGLVAAASLLFSPLCLFLAVSPAPFGISVAIGAAMLFLLWRFHTRRSAAALAAFAALAGIGATQLHLLHVSLLGMALAILLALRRPRVEPALLVVALCGFVAPTVPSLGALPALGQVRQEYVSHRWQWAGLEGVLHEQRGLQRRPTPEQLMYAGTPAPFDIQIGTLLMPFAVPRTALRLIGDVLFEPISAALAAVGIAIALLRARRDPLCASAVAVLAVSLLPAFAGSQYDRISLTRAILLPVSLGIFTALAFHALATTFLSMRWYAPAAMVLVSLIAVSGCAVFDVVNPRILGTSAMELALEVARDGADQTPMAVIAGKGKREVDWLHVERIARHVAARPLDVVHFAQIDDLSTPQASAAQVFLWSPGIEEDADVSRALAELMPSATLYELRSRSGLSRLYAAARDGRAWQPRLAPGRWTARDLRSSTSMTEPNVR